MEHAYFAAPWGKGDGDDYLNCPLDRETYEAFAADARRAIAPAVQAAVVHRVSELPSGHPFVFVFPQNPCDRLMQRQRLVPPRRRDAHLAKCDLCFGDLALEVYLTRLERLKFGVTCERHTI